MQDKINQIITSSIAVKMALLDHGIIDAIQKATEICISSIQAGGVIYFCGNGGSAADAQHLSAELSGKFYFDRKPLPSEALHVNTSYLTAVANDYGFEFVYSRMVEGMGKYGDVLFGLSTSGTSKNVLNAFKSARDMGMHVIGLTGGNDNFNDYCDILIRVPSMDTPRIQEAHLLVGHTICQLIEENIFK